jgi:hypothetical protein
MIELHVNNKGRNSVVPIANHYGVNSLRFGNRWRDFSKPNQKVSEDHPASCTVGTGPLSRG